MATPQQTFPQLPGLGKGWRLVRTDCEAGISTFVICVEETPKLWEQKGGKWKQRVTCYDHVEPMSWRHLNVFHRECVIVTALPRG